MKIIQIVGRSNSGKTTFIKNLIPELKKKGTVAVIKHLGDHTYNIEEGKDTTVFFDSGADISVGVDSHKAVATFRKNTLDDVLGMLLDQGMDFAIIEGFKQRSFPKIVIGSLTADTCILTNPAVTEVITSLNLFENFRK
ncbi:molybdopterin-guanine dinucleotide biosynthesis protein B [Candidatus Bathyarchaeota archaeon]|jgi:molybdopterin-guanine dinucleotide biosynthesis protein MobB|nr:molybdopterin-guanine dinucleotide biosynthesis protein B [Candidatus Bathyarchaeota archaeon]